MSLQDEGRSQTIVVPIDMPLVIPGSHEYVLDTVTDGLGNVRPISANRKEVNSRSGKTIRSVDVLRRSALSFSNCASGRPTTLLLDSETPLTIIAKESDLQDGPWDVTVKYEPSPAIGNEKYVSKPWVKKLAMPASENKLTFNAKHPGEYSVTGVKGRHCPGDVLSPESCKVVLQPYPSAEINWKRIHEW